MGASNSPTDDYNGESRSTAVYTGCQHQTPIAMGREIVDGTSYLYEFCPSNPNTTKVGESPITNNRQTHTLTLLQERRAPREKPAPGSDTYYVHVNTLDAGTIDLVSHRTGSTTRFKKHTVFPLTYRETLTKAGYDILDPLDSITTDTLNELTDWLTAQGVETKHLDISLNPVEARIEIHPVQFLTGDAWDTYIEVMRKYDMIHFDNTKDLHYIPDNALANLPNFPRT
ncbi:hypothetical protein [Salinibaculum rarum]|uniref:hypothetical protein n=1 Tax=Salinibaculum rarum TaxID=3058903 RepID=UPI00265D860B|nr:hypothetical protein [Salinibaculum sp. KK48]